MILTCMLVADAFRIHRLERAVEDNQALAQRAIKVAQSYELTVSNAILSEAEIGQAINQMRLNTRDAIKSIPQRDYIHIDATNGKQSL